MAGTGAGGVDLGAAYGETLRQLRAMLGEGRAGGGGPGTGPGGGPGGGGGGGQWREVELEWEGDLGIELHAPPGSARLDAARAPGGGFVVTVAPAGPDPRPG